MYLPSKTGIQRAVNLLFICKGNEITKMISFPTERELQAQDGDYAVAWPLNPCFTGKSGIIMLCEEWAKEKGLYFSESCEFIERIQ